MQQIAYFIILSFPLWKDRIPLSKTVSGDRRPFMAEDDSEVVRKRFHHLDKAARVRTTPPEIRSHVHVFRADLKLSQAHS
jgi:hypothetical protein